MQTLRLLALGLLVAVGLGAQSAFAGDDRPKEIPYETPGEFPQLSPKQTDHVMVLIQDNALNPRLVTVNEGQLVAWISYSKTPSAVVFERDVARSMVCHSLVNFTIKDDELRSAPIHAGEFASFCQLKPGRYKYKVVRPDVPNAGADSARKLEGEIVVGNQ